jgi:GAF domain-containing protein
MRKRLVIAGTSREGLELLPLLEANPAVEVCALLATDPEQALAELRRVDPAAAARFAQRVTTDVAAVVATPGLAAIVDAGAAPPLRERLATLRGVQLLPPALARMLYAYGPADAMSKPDLLQALREILESYDLTHDRRALLQLVLQIAVTATGADRGSLMLWDARECVLRVEVAQGIEEELIAKIRVPAGEGIAGRAFAAERSILLHGKADRGRFEIVRERDDVESAISAPLVHDGRVLGVLNLSHARNQHQFSAEDQLFVDELARLDARIIARAEEFHGLLRESQTLRAEAEVRRRLARGGPLVRRLTAVCASLAGQLRGGVCQLYLREAESDTLVLQAASMPLDPLALRERLRFGEGLPGRAAALGRAVLLGGGSADDAGLCYAALPLCLEARAAGAPAELVGVLAVQGERAPGDTGFDVERLRAGASALADELAGALRSARLERDSRRAAQLAEVVASLTASGDERELAERATAHAIGLLEAQDAVLRLREEPSGRYRIAAWSGVGEWRKAALAELERKLATDAMRERRLVRVSDLAGDPAWRDHAVGIGTAMIAPLLRDGRALGCLSVLGKVPEDPLLGERFGADDERLLAQLAQHVLVAHAGLARPERSDADPVTGLVGERALRERLEAELARSLARGHPLVLIELRVEGLDALREPAHADGAERAALAVAQALRGMLRDFDVAGRIAPHAFAALIPEPEDEVASLLTGIYRRAREALDAQGDAARGLELRLGYAVYPQDGADAETLARVARERRVEAL